MYGRISVALGGELLLAGFSIFVRRKVSGLDLRVFVFVYICTYIFIYIHIHVWCMYL